MNRKYIMVIPRNKNLEYIYDGFNNSKIYDSYLIQVFSPWDEEIKKINIADKDKYYIDFFQNKIPVINNTQYVFILYSRLLEWRDVNLAELLKNVYKNSKLVCYFGDLIKKHNIEIDVVKEKFDKVFDFDKKEAVCNGICFLNEPYGKDLSQYINNCKPEYDVTFIGVGKGRIKKLIEIYDFLDKNGIRCLFYIFDIPKINQINRKGIIYNKWVEYTDLLKIESNSRCILELLQEGQYSYTTRFSEAMLMNKKLISDCEEISEWCNQNIIYSKKVSDIDINKIRENNNIKDDGFWRNKLSNDNMINIIESELDK